MLKSSARSAIRLRGVRHNNLKNFDLDLPLHQLIVITGLSGSGKSSLAFDTLFAEGQRRYIETFSPYARQFFDRMDKPQVDSIEGIPPAIAIEQRNAVKTTRSTVGTMTELCDYMKMLWPHIAQLHCRQCGRMVRADSPQRIWEALQDGTQSAESESRQAGEPRDCLITFELPLSEKLPLEECLGLIAKQGYQRLLLEEQVVRLDEVAPRAPRLASRLASLTVIQDRVRLEASNRARLVEACEQAYHFGKSKLAVRRIDAAGRVAGAALRFSNHLHCAACDIEYHEPSPALFSFNHPVGACPTCRGFGRVIGIDYNLALPDTSKTLAEGVVKPWQTGQGAECQSDLLRMCRRFGVPTDVPFEELPRKWQDFVIEGEPDYGKDEQHEWPSAWYGVKGYFRWLESKAYKMHVRVLLSRYRAYTPCPDCQGKRLQPEALLYRCQVGRAQGRSPDAESRNGPEKAPESLTLADFYQLPIRDAAQVVERLAARHQLRPNDPLAITFREVRSRLGYLNEVGLGYLTLDRPTRSLSGGETERVNLTTCLGTCLVNTLYVLDEPSVGLHPRDTERLVRVLQQLRQAGNTVVVVEHEASVMRAADQLIDLGPGHGATGGQVVFQGTYKAILGSRESLTGQYLSGRRQIEIPERRRVTPGSGSPGTNSASGTGRCEALLLQEAPGALGRSSGPTARERERLAPGRNHGNSGKAEEALPALRISQATRHNLRNLSVEIPLGRLVCVTGVSGSGKTTLIREVLLPALTARLKSGIAAVKASDRLSPERNGDEGEADSEAGELHLAVLAGAEHLGRVVLVDQSILGKTPRSNPAVYIGAFDDIRECFAQSEAAKQRGLNASAFSFNSSQGQCERCRGAGFEKIEMQFLSDVYIRCPDCHGRRYRSHILEVKLRRQEPGAGNPHPRKGRRAAGKGRGGCSIADLLDATVEEAVEFLAGLPGSRPAQRAIASLKLLEEVGLGYLKLGQPINTLSGGESQRLKLVRELADANAAHLPAAWHPANAGGELPASLGKPTLFLFDEPTTGLHFEDVRVLLKVFQRLVNAGHSVLVIEHNLDVIKSADWVLDLGPDAGDQGGQLVAQGTPEDIARCPGSYTGQALRNVLSEAASAEASTLRRA